MGRGGEGRGCGWCIDHCYISPSPHAVRQWRGGEGVWLVRRSLLYIFTTCSEAMEGRGGGVVGA